MKYTSTQYAVERIVRCRVHYAYDDQLIGSHGLTVVRSEDSGRSLEKICRIPHAPRERLLGMGKWAARLFRADIHMIVPARDGQLVVFAGRRIFSINAATGSIESNCKLHGSRPLCVCSTKRAIYYGEYRRNSERSPVSIWSSQDSGLSWQAVWKFRGVRHVHGVFEDPLDESIWVTTGDDDDESVIWRTTDNFSSIEPVISDGQRSRAVALIFSEAAVYFGTDIPHQKNTIRQYNRVNGQRTTLADTEGPVFFASCLRGHAFFSTSVEPSKTNSSKDVVIYASSDWRTWVEALRFKKDWLPPVLFQYGQARFAAGPGDGQSVWVSPFGTTYDQQSLKLAWLD